MKQKVAQNRRGGVRRKDTKAQKKAKRERIERTKREQINSLRKEYAKQIQEAQEKIQVAEEATAVTE